MPLVAPLEEHEIAPELLAALSAARGVLGFIPASVRTMAHVPEIAAAFMPLYGAVMAARGTLSPELKRLVAYAASQASGCLYCQAHTMHAAERFGVGSARLDALWEFEDSPLFTADEKVALRFAHRAASVPNGVTEADWAAMRAAYAPADIVELMSVVAVFGFLNRWNDSMGTALEDLPRETAEIRLGQAGWHVGKHVESGGDG